jgi:MSHA pilin protein MshC
MMSMRSRIMISEPDPSAGRTSCSKCVGNGSRSARVEGFTLVELVMVMVLTGILAVYAIPKFVDNKSFNARGFHDETLAALRYAQKSAIAQRRTVCVAFTTTSVSLTVAQNPDVGTCDTPLTGPTSGNAQYVVTASSGVNFTAAPSSFSFNARGQATLSGARQTMQVSGVTSSIRVDRETGYVY